jgi:hypothetical protein
LPRGKNQPSQILHMQPIVGFQVHPQFPEYLKLE